MKVPFTLAPDHSPEEVHQLSAAADIFVSPPDNIQESFGLALLKAGSDGLPVRGFGLGRLPGSGGTWNQRLSCPDSGPGDACWPSEMRSGRGPLSPADKERAGTARHPARADELIRRVCPPDRSAEGAGFAPLCALKNDLPKCGARPRASHPYCRMRRRKAG